jgi:hypothetical protein
MPFTDVIFDSPPVTVSRSWQMILRCGAIGFLPVIVSAGGFAALSLLQLVETKIRMAVVDKRKFRMDQ